MYAASSWKLDTIQNASEQSGLLSSRICIRPGRCEVCHHACKRYAGSLQYELDQFGSLVGATSAPSHASINLDMNTNGDGLPGCQYSDLSELMLIMNNQLDTAICQSWHQWMHGTQRPNYPKHENLAALWQTQQVKSLFDPKHGYKRHASPPECFGHRSST
jgi:NADH:ubiquinone oxidoreductase subunit